MEVYIRIDSLKDTGASAKTVNIYFISLHIVFMTKQSLN